MKSKLKSKYIFVTGGVLSTVGKGITAASVFYLLKEAGFKVKINKFDPYLNEDCGTMNPKEHGEIFVTHDKGEVDLDLGSYERFLNIETRKRDVMTSGNFYKKILEKERRGLFFGKNVQIMPDMVNEICDYIVEEDDGFDFSIFEIGGTAGDVELLPYLNAIRIIGGVFIHVGWIPYLQSSLEFKTKPFQHSLQFLMSSGIVPDILILRSELPLNNEVTEKIKHTTFNNNIITISNRKSVYEVPSIINEQNILKYIFHKFNMKEKNIKISNMFNDIVRISNSDKYIARILLIGKYKVSPEVYKSIEESIQHASFIYKGKSSIVYKICDSIEDNGILHDYDACVFLGGFGTNLTDRIIELIGYTRVNNIPTLLICFGMQLAMIEMARNVLKISDATSVEFSEEGSHIVCVVDDDYNPVVRNKRIGGTLRVGGINLKINTCSRLYDFYKNYHRLKEKDIVVEKFRHRYWINHEFQEKFEKIGVIFCMKDEDNKNGLEAMELKNHKFFVGTQFHPELYSTFYNPHPIFIAFIKAIIK
ncbi:CTP synthase [Rickettsiales bacterium (ex Bugula neritina AB1)]|nr:CTP synthase [Rickettsiales bacterium (ex Bugula neritina AB1)]